MELQDIIPGKIEFTLERLDRPITLNLLTLEDNVWLNENYPGEELSKVYTDPRVMDILKIATRVMDIESKRYLAKVEIIQVDDYGDEVSVGKLTIPEKLFRLVADGELAVIISSIFEVRKRSNDIIQKLNAKYSDQKKREEVKEEKEQPSGK